MKDLYERLGMKNIQLTTKSDWVKVTISAEEVEDAKKIGELQQKQSKDMGCKDNSITKNSELSLHYTVISKQAEFAVKRFGGGTARVTAPGEFHDYPDVGSVNVRYTFDLEDSLMIMKKDQGLVPLVFVGGISPNFLLLGWTIPNYAKYVTYKINCGKENFSFGIIHDMRPHEAVCFPKSMLMPMWSINKDLLK